MKYTFPLIRVTIILQVVFCGLLFPQSSKEAIQSLQNYVDGIRNDTARVAMLLDLSKKYAESESDKAFHYAFQALTLATNIEFGEEIGRAHNNLGDLYWYKNDFVSAAEHYSTALGIFETLEDKAAIAECYRNIGWIRFGEKNYADALTNYTTSLSINKELGLNMQASNNYNDMGIVYYELKNYNEAINNYCLAFEIAEAKGNKLVMAAIYDNLGRLYDILGNNEEAIGCAMLCNSLGKEVGNKRYVTESFFNIAQYYMEIDSIEKSSLYYDSVLYYAQVIKDNTYLKKGYSEYAKLKAKQGNYEKAIEYLTICLGLSDSIFNETNRRQLTEMTAKYEADKKIQAIENLQKEKLLAEEKLTNEQKAQLYPIIFCIMVLVFVVVLYISNRQRKKANTALQKASEEIDEKSRNITDSINYSKHIQDVCLPAKELKYALFGDIFIFFRSKDVVSGDFYWYAEKSGKRIIACCDCTGHGVSGALMSMIGNTMLNKIVVERGVVSPDEVLNQLNIEVRRALKQDNDRAATRDGMDVALLVFDSPQPNGDCTVHFAGAHRPVWVVKHNTREHPAMDSFIEIKQDKHSIGGVHAGNKVMFTKHSVQLSKGDMVYIFTDGYTDQVGGEKGKRYSGKRFKNLLVNSSNKSVQEQEHILQQTLNDWKKEEEQVDDILIIGIRI